MFFKGRTGVSLRNRFRMLTKSENENNKKVRKDHTNGHPELKIDNLLSKKTSNSVVPPHLPIPKDLKVLKVVVNEQIH